jgi:hypothetical protein
MRYWQDYDFELNNDLIRASSITSTFGPLTEIEILKEAKGIYTVKTVLSFLIIPAAAPPIKFTLIERETIKATKDERKECLCNAIKFF